MTQYIVPAVLAFIVGLFLWIVKREHLALEYYVVESDPFPREGGVGKYFVCELKNTGNRAIENVSFKIEVSKGAIDSIKYSNAQLFNISEQANTFVQGVLPLLNPKERFGTMLTIKNAEDDSNIKVEARAIGATASKKSSETMPQYIQSFLLIIAVAFTFFSIWSTFSQSRITKSIEKIGEISALTKDLDARKQKLDELKNESEKRQTEFEELQRKEEDLQRKEKQGEPQREQIVFAILNRSGLSHVIPGLISISGEGLPFWKTGLHLMHSYLLDKSNARKYVNALVELANVDSIAPSSKGFLLYLAGKIEKSEGNSNNAIQYFEICKKETPLMYEYLMAQDPAYDLASVKMWLTKNKIK